VAGVTVRVPNPLLLLLACVGVAAALTWVVPAGAFERRVDVATGRTVVIAGTFTPAAPAPVGPFAAVVAVPRGIVESADVLAVILFVGGAWVLLDRLGVLGRFIDAFVSRFRRKSVLAIPGVTVFFATMGALANMQEEIIPLVPALLLLGRRLGVDAVTVVAMSAGAAMVGSAFGPTNPFQAGIAMRLAELPPLSHAIARTVLLVVAVGLWMAWTMRHARRNRTGIADAAPGGANVSRRDLVALLCLVLPMAAYVYGAVAWQWGFNELSSVFIVGAVGVGLAGHLSLADTVEAYLDGMKTVLASAIMVGVARSISLVLSDGGIVDTILNALAAPLVSAPPATAAFLMVPFHMLVHVPVSSVSGHAVLTMPLLVPLSDLIGLSRHVTVLAYQVGAGLTELLTPTNGALMAILFAAGVPFGRWLRFAAAGTAIVAVAGLIAMFMSS
jgi:uncharacterized ion transporter superfamily protein YfcC